jgi:tyrosine-specific transport protein
MSDFIKGLSVYIGTIIGVGIFGLPYVAAKTGFLVILGYFLILGSIAVVMHLMYVDIILGTPGKHRFPGYVKKYLGKKWSKVTFISICIGLFGAQLAYLVVGGGFLASLLMPYLGGSVLLYTLIYFALGSFIIFKGLKHISITEFIILLLFFILLIFFIIKGSAVVDVGNLLTIKLNNFILPYGIVLFSLWGSSILPEVREVTAGDRKTFRKTVVTGIIVAAITYILFIAVVVGITGSGTTQNAIDGLREALGSKITNLGLIFGLITCFSSYLTVGLTLKKVFWYDMKASKNISWAIAAFVPLFLYIIGARQFIVIISLMGALTLGLESVINIFMYKVFLKKKKKKKINPLYYFLSGLFIIGIIVEILSQLGIIS